MESESAKARRLAAQERILRENENPSPVDVEAFQKFAPVVAKRYQGIDIDKHRYFTAPGTLLSLRGKLDITPLQVLIIIYIHNYKDYRSTWMDYSFIAQGIGIQDKDTVRKSIKALRQRGLVIATEHPENATSHKGNRYDFTPLWLELERLRLAEEYEW
jgi:hypothetical protein